MKTNADLQKDVYAAIKWEPSLDPAEIGVTANDGVVTLTGVVNSYIKKSKAEDIAKTVTGVKVVVENIHIKLSSLGKKNDNEIAAEILKALEWNWDVLHEKITVKVEGGWVTLDGEMEWNYQKDDITKCVSKLDGVTEITNNIIIKSGSHDEIEQKDIESAIDRNWSTNDEDIQVQVSSTAVTLTGKVDSLYQKDVAEKIVWKTPGVLSVNNELVVEYNYALTD